MTKNAITIYTKIMDAMTRAARADRQAQELICDLFLTGSRVRWMHGDHIRSGTVRGSCGSDIGALRFNIESRSGRTYWIGAYRLLSFVGLEHTGGR